ncbi:hypothetical protein, partial [Klebsiella pneumoniae]|uniref:hypothetical protein n=1 Tax=Klebsiella pneumoniae TaxID=573 RepID=UPI00163D5285
VQMLDESFEQVEEEYEEIETPNTHYTNVAEESYHYYITPKSRFEQEETELRLLTVRRKLFEFDNDDRDNEDATSTCLKSG